MASAAPLDRNQKRPASSLHARQGTACTASQAKGRLLGMAALDVLKRPAVGVSTTPGPVSASRDRTTPTMRAILLPNPFNRREHQIRTQAPAVALNNALERALTASQEAVAAKNGIEQGTTGDRALSAKDRQGAAVRRDCLTNPLFQAIASEKCAAASPEPVIP